MYQLPTAVASTFGWIGTLALGIIPDDMNIFWSSDAEPNICAANSDDTNFDVTTDFDCFGNLSG